jgi:hypothetical protein
MIADNRVSPEKIEITLCGPAGIVRVFLAISFAVVVPGPICVVKKNVSVPDAVDEPEERFALILTFV